LGAVPLERAANALGAYLAAQLGLDEEKQEVVAFGALALLQNGASALLLLVLALSTGILPEALAALLTAGILRHATGGTHLQTPLRCVATTALGFWAGGFVGHLAAQSPLCQATAPTVAACAVAGGLWVIYRWAPVEAETRPLSSQHKAYLRRLSLRLGWLVSIVLVGGAFFRAWWWAPGLMGVAIQCISLTPPGHWLTRTIDCVCSRLQGR